MTSKSISCAVAASGREPTTVRQTPLTAIDAPCAHVVADDARRGRSARALSPRAVERADLAELLDDPGEHR